MLLRHAPKRVVLLASSPVKLTSAMYIPPSPSLAPSVAGRAICPFGFWPCHAHIASGARLRQWRVFPVCRSLSPHWVFSLCTVPVPGFSDENRAFMLCSLVCFGMNGAAKSHGRPRCDCPKPMDDPCAHGECHRQAKSALTG
jgi:hypothetical protein